MSPLTVPPSSSTGIECRTALVQPVRQASLCRRGRAATRCTRRATFSVAGQDDRTRFRPRHPSVEFCWRVDK